jgi:hypothetical protein
MDAMGIEPNRGFRNRAQTKSEAPMAKATDIILKAIEEDIEFATYIWGGETPQEVRNLLEEWIDMSLGEGEEDSVAMLLLRGAIDEIDFRKVLKELEQLDLSGEDGDEEGEDEE